MMDSDYTIQNLIESAITLPDIISCLVGMLISLVAYKFEFLGKKAWFGNSCSVWTLIMCIVAAIVLLAFKLFWLLPCILLIPIAVLGGRYCWLEYRKKKVLKYRGLLDYDKKRYDYYVWLSKRELFRWEVKKYLLPAMNILFEIGSIKKLDDELELLSDYKDWYKWKRLKSYVHWNRHEYQKVIDMMAPYIDEGKLNGTELTGSGDGSLIRVYFRSKMRWMTPYGTPVSLESWRKPAPCSRQASTIFRRSSLSKA